MLFTIAHNRTLHTIVLLSYHLLVDVYNRLLMTAVSHHLKLSYRWLRGSDLYSARSRERRHGLRLRNLVILRLFYLLGVSSS